MSVLTRVRRLWLDVHLWLGAALFIPFAVLGLTGSVLVWRASADRILAPHHYEVSAGAPAPLAADLVNARAAFGEDFVVASLRAPAQDGDPMVAQARARARPAPGERPRTRSAWIDPATGRVLDVGPARSGLLGLSHDLHGSLMFPGAGRQVVGWLGLFMLASSLTGIWLWWPRGALLAGLRWKRGPRTTYNLHHLTGFWIAIPLAVLAATGAFISFPRTSAALTGMFVETRAPEARAPGGGGPPPLTQAHLDVDTVVRAALAAAPDDARFVSVTLPTRGRDGAAANWRVQVRSAGQDAMTSISVADDTGEASVRGERAAPSAGENVARLMRRLHDGDDLPITWRVIITIAGFAPALLGVTGVVMWLRRQSARRAIQRRYAGAAQAGE